MCVSFFILSILFLFGFDDWGFGVPSTEGGNVALGKRDLLIICLFTCLHFYETLDKDKEQGEESVIGQLVGLGALLASSISGPPVCFDPGECLGRRWVDGVERSRAG